MNNNIIYALDFDGVICDSAVETAITGWKAAITLWPDMSGDAPQALVDQFKIVRPIIETGYEAILAMRLLYVGETTDAIYADYQAKTQHLITDAGVTVDGLKTLFGATRDSWIANDLVSWINQNPLFPGVADKLRQLENECQWWVITTKQERFVKYILQAHGITLPDSHIFGLDRNLSKVQVLQQLIAEQPHAKICFVEDRLPTLLNVLKQASLADVELIFALWGYNTAEDKHTAAQQPLTLQDLADFLS